MKKKRGVGERSQILFDAIDCQIASTLLKEQSLGVLELGKKLGGMKHANLKKHLDKMESMNLIKRNEVPKSRKLLVSLNEKIYTKERVKALLEMLGWNK